MLDREFFNSASDGCTSYACGCVVLLVLFVGGGLWALWWLWNYFT
jgi:hypothetical protein